MRLSAPADPGYFSALQIPLIRGRVFTEQERLDRDQYTVVSKKFADKFFPGENPIGRRVTVESLHKTYEIIGVVGDTMYDVTQPIMPMMYFPILSGIPDQTSAATLVVRTAGDPLSLSIPIQQQVAALDPALPVYDILTMQQVVGKSTATQSFSATLVLAFATLSLLLAAIGLYGVLSYLVAQRNTEIGIRMALGAQRSEVLRLVLFDGLRPVLIGLVIGLVGRRLRRLRSFVRFCMGPAHWIRLCFRSMVASLLLTAVIACVLPAIRASKIEPMQALRIQ